MRTPRYFFTGDFSAFHEYFLSRPHVRRSFARGAFLWPPGEPFGRMHYILSGAARCCVEHENGRRKIISFHGAGTLFPVYHERDYKIELAITTEALSQVETIEFSKADFRAMFRENGALAAALVEWYASYVNLLLYETAHQEYNGSAPGIQRLVPQALQPALPSRPGGRPRRRHAGGARRHPRHEPCEPHARPRAAPKRGRRAHEPRPRRNNEPRCARSPLFARNGRAGL